MFLERKAACPMYCSTRQGYMAPTKANLIDAALKWPRSANIASAPVMARRTPPRGSQPSFPVILKNFTT
uniref:Uncharacterized protein n=1 Tax=Arundo donax TaxID=35708 RepID=A0A0A9D585_ARUDO